MFSVNASTGSRDSLYQLLFTAWVPLYYKGQMTITWRRIFSGVGDFGTARIEETVGGIRVVKAFANEEHRRSLFAQDNENYHATKLKRLQAHGR